MNLSLVKNAVTSTAARQVLKVRKNSPVILFATGVVGMATTTVLACKATLELENVVEDIEKKKTQVDFVMNSEHRPDSYTSKTAAKDLHIIRVQGAVQIAKLYVPAALVGAATIAAFTGAHVVLTRRNTALMAAYAVLEKGFAEYRERVRDELGEDKERQIRMAGKTVKVKAREDGKEFDHPLSFLGGNKSIYARLWDQHTTTSWNPQPEYNLAFLTAQQNYMNDRLKSRGHLFLNEVYDQLGLEHTKEGAVVGWVKNHGDNFVDFSLFDRDDPNTFMDFITGNEGGIWLDFNVDGVIYDLI